MIEDSCLIILHTGSPWEDVFVTLMGGKDGTNRSSNNRKAYLLLAQTTGLGPKHLRALAQEL